MTVTFQMEELENGLRIIGERDTNAHTSAVGFWVSTGARDESTESMGVSHFLEHMMFKGTASRSAEEVNRDFDSIGAVNNAFTSAEMTATPSLITRGFRASRPAQVRSLLCRVRCKNNKKSIYDLFHIVLQP